MIYAVVGSGGLHPEDGGSESALIVDDDRLLISSACIVHSLMGLYVINKGISSMSMKLYTDNSSSR